MNKFMVLFVLSSFAFSCTNGTGSKYKPKTPAFGKMNDVVVVCDKNLWESAVGDTFGYYFESAYPVMTQPEAIFDVRHMTPEELEVDDLKKQLRTFVILANLADAASPASKMVKNDLGTEKYNKALVDSTANSSVGIDKWAKEQLIVYLYGKDIKTLISSIVQNFPAVTKRIQRHDEIQLHANVYARKQNNNSANDLLTKEYGIDIQIPADYVKSPLKADFTWYRRDFNGVSQHLIFARKKYTKPDDLSKESLISWRDELTSKIEGSSKGSFMKCNPTDLPVYEYAYQHNGYYTKELRGIWEMENDFMGGPYFLYTLLNTRVNEIILIDAFVFAPGKDKRDYMQQLEHIVKTTRIIQGI
ncbi:MAG: DUF4837 family protein [Saprospiraceae bacterium]|nr:DUF4837 family protein [Saprospiraceae bacterium]